MQTTQQGYPRRISGMTRCSHRLLSQPTLISTAQSLQSAYQHFVQVLEALKLALKSWLQPIAHDPIPFMIPSISFLEVYNRGFPAVDTREFPDQIVDPQAFSPLQEMLHGYIWRLTCDQVLVIGTLPAGTSLAIYLA